MKEHLQPQKANRYPMTLVAKAAYLAMCIEDNEYPHGIPVKITGESGCGKSAVIQQLHARLENWKYYDVRVSDKEPTDIGGIPYPIFEVKTQTGKVVWLQCSDMLPFAGEGDPDERSIICFEEFDRTSNPDVHNMCLQILHDRQINGRKLKDGARMVILTNGTADVGTMPMPEAANKRMIHLYVDVEHSGTLDSWTRWAENTGVNPAMIGYAKGFPELFHGSKGHEYTEEQKPCARTSMMANAVMSACKKVSWGKEVRRMLVEGCVGRIAAPTLMGFFDQYDLLPKVEEILSDPDGVELPDTTNGFGLYFALAGTLRTEGKVNGVEDIDRVEKFATYVSRWPEEHQALFYKKASEDLPSIVSTKAYKNWEKTYRI